MVKCPVYIPIKLVIMRVDRSSQKVYSDWDDTGRTKQARGANPMGGHSAKGVYHADV